MALCSGTVALEIAARILGLSGEVIVPSLTFVASASALEWLGIRPVFCDVDSETYCIDPAAVEDLISPATSGVLGVHLFGRPCDVGSLAQIAARRGLTLFFDAAHAFGCSSHGRMIGNFGACEVFSFHATKWFNTLEGGAIATNDPDLAHRARLARNFGFEDWEVRSLGINGKMNEVCRHGPLQPRVAAALPRLQQEDYDTYRAALRDTAGIRVIEYDETEWNNYQYVVAEVLPGYGITRDELLALLHANNVLARSYFAPGCHNVEPFCSRAADEVRLPHTTGLCERLIAFPTGTRVSVDDVAIVAGLVRAGGRSGA